MSILGALLIGLLVGIAAKFLTPGHDPVGWLLTILFGLVGSFIAAYLGQSLGLYQDGQPAGFLASVIGATVLLLLYRSIMRTPHA